MNHIKKSFFMENFVSENELTDKGYDFIEVNQNYSNSELSNHKDSIAIIKTTKDELIGGFVHKVNGKNYIFPVPDPTLIYFNNAQMSIKLIELNKRKLLQKLDFNNEVTETAINEIYSYYGSTSGFVIFLFTSIEAFINRLIPDNIKFENKLTKKTEVYSKNQILEFVDFKTKITDVVKQATGKDFFSKQTPTNQMIWNLKEFRDEIVHTKPNENPLKYDSLIKKSLNFKYKKALEAAAKFMNFHIEEYIVECDCGMDF